MSHAYDYPDRDAVLGCISNVENATAKLRAFADDYLEMRQKSGPEDAMTIEAAKLVLPWVEEIDTSQRELAQHLPNMLAAGDQATYWLDKSLSANDAAATYTRDLKKLGPELFGSGAAFTVDEKVEAPNSHGGALFNIKTMTGKVVPVTANLSDTISTLKSRYQEREGVPPDQQRLIFKGKQLDDDAKTLAECTISAGETLHLVLRVTPSNSGKSAEEREKDSAMVDIEMMSEGDADEVLENAFAVFDADKSGSLSATELKDILTREGNNALSEADAQEIISTVDANGDGQLNISEFIQLMKSRADI